MVHQSSLVWAMSCIGIRCCLRKSIRYTSMLGSCWNHWAPEVTEYPRRLSAFCSRGSSRSAWSANARENRATPWSCNSRNPCTFLYLILCCVWFVLWSWHFGDWYKQRPFEINCGQYSWTWWVHETFPMPLIDMLHSSLHKSLQVVRNQQSVITWANLQEPWVLV